MECHKISRFLNDSTRFVTRKWIKVNNLSNDQDFINKNIKIKTQMLQSDLCHYVYCLLLLKEKINLLATAANEKKRKTGHLIHAYEKPIILSTMFPGIRVFVQLL